LWGWWIDGCYFADEMYRHPKPPNFQSFTQALKAGNSRALVAFNPGQLVPLICTPRPRTTRPEKSASTTPYVRGRWVERNHHAVQWHATRGSAPIGEAENRHACRWISSPATRSMPAAHQGVVTWDAPTGDTGLIKASYLRILDQLTAAVNPGEADRLIAHGQPCRVPNRAEKIEGDPLMMLLLRSSLVALAVLVLWSGRVVRAGTNDSAWPPLPAINASVDITVQDSPAGPARLLTVFLRYPRGKLANVSETTGLMLRLAQLGGVAFSGAPAPEKLADTFNVVPSE